MSCVNNNLEWRYKLQDNTRDTADNQWRNKSSALQNLAAHMQAIPHICKLVARKSQNPQRKERRNEEESECLARVACMDEGMEEECWVGNGK